MNKDQRQVYLELAKVVDWDICSFCKFNYPDAYGGSPCDSGESSCHHPLNKFVSFPFFDDCPESGADCWAFRPQHDISFCADIVGILLEKDWEGCVWWENKKGQWKVAEVKPY